MKSIASFFRSQDHKPKPSLLVVVTPRQLLIVSTIVLAMSVYPLVTVPFGRPTSWFSHSLLVVCASLSVISAPSWCLLTLIDFVRRKRDARLIAASVLSLAGVAALATFIYLRICQLHGL